MSALRPFLVALQFLTRIPAGPRGMASEREIGLSLLYYPLVGLLIGALLFALDRMLDHAPDAVRAALLLAVWVSLSGALHLDGLADSADAWLGGHGDRERTLAIMKDPHSGPAAVVVLMVVLLLKYAALTALHGHVALAAAPLLGRGALPLLFLTTPYVRQGGLGAAIAARLPRRGAVAVTLGSAVLVAAIAGAAAPWLLLAWIALFVALRRLMLRRLGGTTGDTAGALVEISETGVLLAAALALA